MLKSSVCYYKDVHIIVKVTITITEAGADVTASETGKKN